MKPQVIAFYLPQYHPTAHNDEWWGKGFTEWTNVVKAKPLFRGHYQPKIPTDLGFYDLRVPEVREQQAQLAREAGVDGFCYYEYWFGNGHEELEMPFREVVESGKPDFPFCLCWANESWFKKFWNNEGSVVDKKVLAEQTYPGKEDYEKHFYARLAAFKDARYIKVDGKLLYVIYKPLLMPDVTEFMQEWQRLARENGLPEFYFVGFSLLPDQEGDAILSKGCNSVGACRMSPDWVHDFKWAVRKLTSIILQRPRTNDYRKLWHVLLTDKERKDERYCPVIMPNWDHTPRSGVNGMLYTHATPDEFHKHCLDALSSVAAKKDNPLVFLKSWNEWGEGNYMEPDMKFGKGFIHALRRAVDAVCAK